jgi:GNAT superfamily N-acetyltransferase
VEEIGHPRALSTEDSLADFDCTSPPLNIWLKRWALANHLAGASRVFVAPARSGIAGFYSLSAGSIEHRRSPGGIRRNMPDPVPLAIMGRLAVDNRFQGRGVGRSLLLDALRQTRRASELVAIRALLVHAKDAEASEFYQNFGFVKSPLDPLTLLLKL